MDVCISQNLTDLFHRYIKDLKSQEAEEVTLDFGDVDPKE